MRKVFGIISYFPNNDSLYHIETRKERSRRFRELLFKLDELWPDVDILIIAQNWKEFKLPPTRNNVTIYEYPKLGILGARKELRERFLNSNYDYLIMLDDDAIISSSNPQAYMDEIDNHPDGVGAIRKVQSPLSLFAISKFVYSQVKLPNIDPEKGEGFEDDIFVATCFSRFPDNSFIFPPEIVSETSFRYDGPGKCPSTWTKEHKYDWDYMRTLTRTCVKAIEHNTDYSIAELPKLPTTDVIISYVNAADQNWLNLFVKATKTHNPTAVRYRSWGTLKYLLRGIEKYMPFVRKVFLVVAIPSQVPIWLDTTKVNVVYHKDFIPKQYLPTFNSCTIESFFWNIKGLADKIIYFNDDMFPIGDMAESDFFTGNVPNIRFTEPNVYSTKAIYQSQCRSGMDLITKALNLPAFEKGKIIRPYHISTAITKDSLKQVSQLCKTTLPSTISMLRLPKNVNQYIYAYYQYFTDNYVDSTVSYKYFELIERDLSNIVTTILGDSYQMVCLNDSDKLKNYNKLRMQLINCFDQKFPNKSRYEL